MSVHVLLNLLNELKELFRNGFNKFNNTKPRLLDFTCIYHMA